MKKFNTLNFNIDTGNVVNSDDFLFHIKTYILDLTEVNGFKYIVQLSDTELKLIPINLTFRWKFYLFWLFFVCFMGLPMLPMAISDGNFIAVFIILAMILFGLIIMYFTYKIERKKALDYLSIKSKIFKNHIV